MNKIETLRARNTQLAGSMEALAAAAEAAGRNMLPEEQTQFDNYDAEFQANEAEVARLQRLEAVQAKVSGPAPRVVQPEMSSTTGIPAQGATSHTPITGSVVAHNYANHGFTKGMGEYLIACRAAVTTGRVDPRLMVNAVTTWAGETVGADGGYALPPQFVQGIMSLVTAGDSFVSALNPFPTQSDIITVPKDEDAPWSTSAITAAKTAEGTAITASKPAVSQLKVPLYGVKSLVHVDEKSLRDMTFLAAYVSRKMSEKIRWQVENYVVNGTGENQPLGILNAPGKYAVTAADGTSTSTQLSAFDIGLMEATALAGPGGFWVAHPRIKAQLRALVTGGTTGFPVFQSDFRNGLTVDTLLGYPYYSSPACKAYNTEGDIIFVKPDGYFLAFEASGVQNASTIAFAFDQNVQSFRSTLYMGGAPSLSGAVLLPDGSTYQSNLVTLAGSRS